MTVIKILFIILLIVPIAFFMRFIIGRLSSETPKQSYTDDQIRAYRTPKKRRQKGYGTEKKANTTKASSSSRTSNTSYPEKKRKTLADKAPNQKERPAGAGNKRTSVYTPRQPAKWQRSERVPFGEAEGFDTYRKSLSSGKTDVPSRSANGDKLPLDSDELLLSNKRKKNRSDKAPSKRQLRKNRERARKRDMKKRKKERKQEGR